MRRSRLMFLLAAILLAAPTSLFAIDDRGFKGEWAVERAKEKQEARNKETQTGGGRHGEGTTESATRSSAPAAPTKPEAKPVVTEAKPAPAPEAQAKSAPESSMFPDQKFSDTQNRLKDATTPQEVMELSIDWNAAYREHTSAGQSQEQDRSDGDTFADLAEEVLEEVAVQETLEALATKSEMARKTLEMFDKVPNSVSILLDVLDPTATATHQQEKASLDRVIQRDVSRKLIELLPPEAIHRLPDEQPDKGPIIRRPRP